MPTNRRMPTRRLWTGCWLRRTTANAGHGTGWMWCASPRPTASRRTPPRPNAWPYRDYVIEAFNKDIPYTQFIQEQMAGDALGVDAATGFLVGGPWDKVKSPDVVLTKNQRDAELHDMVATTGSAFLGLTIGLREVP